MHKLSKVAYDGYSYWWVCTCRAFGPLMDSHGAALDDFTTHRKAMS